MDTSETYIKMCNCEEIQALKPQDAYKVTEEINSTRLFGKKQIIIFTGEHIVHLIHIDGTRSVVWLPTQSQLQEMLGGFNLLQFWQKFFSYSDYVIQSEVGFELPEWATRCESWEQLWLAFVQKELHNKVWVGEEWLIPEEVKN